MIRCQICHKSLNSNYIRVGSKDSIQKIGVYCIACDIYYSPNLQKQYTVLQKEYTVNPSPLINPHKENKTILIKNAQNHAQNETRQRMLRPGFEPGIVALRGRNA